MKANTTLVLSLALLIAPLTGCVESLKSGDEGIGATSSDLSGFGVDITATGAADAGVNYLILGIDRVLVHEAGGNDTDWFVLQDPAEKAIVVRAGTTETALAGNGELPNGDYDTVMVEVSSIRTQGASGDHHEHSEGGDTHDHAVERNVTLQIGAPVDLTIDGSDETRITLTLDMAKSDLESATPRLAVSEAAVVVDGVVADTIDVAASGGLPGAKPPVARINVFGPDGALEYKADFVADDGDMINTAGTAYALGDELRFVGSDSEVQVGGTQIVEYAWDFDDGSTESGPSVAHAFEDAGVFEVTLTVTDDRGVSDSQMIRVVALPKAPTDVFTAFTFDDDGSGFTAEASSYNPADGSEFGEPQWTWELTDAGNSSTGWRLSGELSGPNGEEPPEGVPSGSPEPLGGVSVEGQGTYSTNTATLTSPSFTVADGVFVGYALDVVGESDGDLVLQISMDGGLTWEQLQEVPTSDDWTTVSDYKALGDHAGHDVMVRLSWTADGPSRAPGWTVDNLVIHGIAFDTLHNGDLLKGTSGDGHDHSH